MSWELHNSIPSTSVARNDYAANGGTVFTQLSDPGTLANGDNDKAGFDAIAQQSTGVVYAGSLIKLADVTDGTASTYLAGEKNLGPDWYTTGIDYGDNETTYIGDDQDITGAGRDFRNKNRCYRRWLTPQAPPRSCASARPSDARFTWCFATAPSIQ